MVKDDTLLFLFSRFEGELECTIVELEESNKKLAALKAETDAAKGAIFPVLLGNKRVANDRAREKEKDLHDMESLLKELLVVYLYFYFISYLHRKVILSFSGLTF